MSDICYELACVQRQKILNKEISAVELTDEYISRIVQYNHKYNGFVTLELDSARKQAQYLDEYFAKTNRTLGLLHGLPIGVKDIFHTKGMLTTFGNLNYKDYIPDFDDIIVAREREAGAILLGKTNTPDCASGGVTTNEIFGLTKNVWNEARTTSGSGGGGVSVLMSGMASLCDGSDIGGSVRTPAAWANCVGFRPTSGRVPGYMGTMADGNISTGGVFSRTVSDALLFIKAIEGPHPDSPVSYPFGQAFEFEKLDNSISDVKIAVSSRFANWDIEPEIADLFEDIIPIFAKQAKLVKEDMLHLDEDYRMLYQNYNAFGVTEGLPERVFQAYEAGYPFPQNIGASVEKYLAMEKKDIRQMFLSRKKLRVQFQNFMQNYDVIVTPAHNCYAFPVDNPLEMQKCDWSSFYLAPLLGLPSVVVPAGFTDDGMPHGIMITGRAGEDMTVLKVARAFEQETEYYKIRPNLS